MIYNEAHINLHTKGSQSKISLFHFIMSALDPDWPYGPAKHRRVPGPPVVCKKCNGAIYQTPNLLPFEIRALAKQINSLSTVPGAFKVKIKMFNISCGELFQSGNPLPLINIADQDENGEIDLTTSQEIVDIDDILVTLSDGVQIRDSGESNLYTPGDIPVDATPEQMAMYYSVYMEGLV